MPVINTAAVRLRANNTASFHETVFAQGWDETVDFGTRGTLFVDQANGSDVNDGSSLANAFATMGAAKAAAVDGDRIKVRAGTYREQIDVKQGVTWEGYGTDKPILTGAEVMTGLVQCTVADQTRVGSNYASIYKKVMNKTSIAQNDPYNMNLHENGERLFICREWGTPNWRALKIEEEYGISPLMGEFAVGNYMTADTIHLKNTDEIDGYTLTSVTNNYTQEQIEGAIIHAFRSPNAISIMEISSFDPVSNKITVVNDTGIVAQGGAASPSAKFAIFNLIPAMEQGQYGWIDEGDETVTVYVRPNNPANINTGIEYSARTLGFHVEGSRCAMRGFDVRQQAGTGTGNGIGIYANTSISDATDVSIDHVKVSKTRQSGDRAAITMNGARAFVNRCSVEDVQNSFGIFMATPGFSRLRRCYVFGAASSPIRGFGNPDSIFDHCLCVASGYSAHANKFNHYQGTIRTLSIGMAFKDCDGYATYQDASQLYYISCLFPATFNAGSGNTSRAFVDQNRSSTPSPTPAGPMVFANNSFIPQPEINGSDLSAVGNTLTLGETSNNHSQVFFDLVNNYWHGGGAGGQTNFRDYNVNSQTAQVPVGANDQSVAISSVFADPVNGDFSVPANSVLRTGTGMSLQDYITNTLEPLFGDRFADWNIDAAGKVFDLTAPHIGCFSDADDYAVYQNKIIDVA
ncbi:hypothetical protein ACEWPL_003865 [Roseovarius sp. S1116L3]|uniref:hypothetical protein n=1 Tax=Roseovarius roseus TaxID=3342636 RepID=UPI00372AF6A0